VNCCHAIFVLTQTVDYFVKNGSEVFMSSLDARKALDRVNHVKLFDKLIDHGFYRAMLCIRGTRCVCLSVSVWSVTSRCSTKTAKRRITQTTPHDTSGSLVF